MILKNRKGFTLIELIVATAIIGISVLLAAPRFLGYVQKAHLARIQNDVKVAENFVTDKLLLNDNKLPNNWEQINTDELTELTQEKKLYDIRGIIVDENDIEEGDYFKLAEKPFNTKLKGNFYTNQGGKVYYEDLKSGIITDEDSNDGNLDGSEKDPVNKDDLINKKEEADKLDPDDYEDFTDVESAIDEADKVIKDDDATQKEVDDALENLEDAMNDLIENPEISKIDNLIKDGYIPIANAEELNNIKSGVVGVFGKDTRWENNYISGTNNKKYVQIKDIDLNSYSNFAPIAVCKWDSYFQEERCEGFSNSIYDGNGYTISNLNMNRPTHDNVGLFAQLYSSTVKNVKIYNANIKGRNSTGILIGKATGGIVENSAVSGVVNGKEWVGGLAGMITDDSIVTQSYSKAMVKADTNVGGLVGYINWNSKIYDSYATGDVSANNYIAGGLVGEATYQGTKIINSYSTGKVTATQMASGLIGAGDDLRFTNSYHDIDTSGQPLGQFKTGRTSVEMKDKSTYIDWDFDNVWEMSIGEYPKLQWQQ